ncbi:hypothetical protein RchiOBHm_Chr1g0357461 [Rosa chinensis]|uniref:Uncharacterized protein n=1 Tax=Rosa chinensis TaxID=74649 RepID=A0A2P6SHX4_ROSCH|nr:hypothetical protein RchiOBHm_Chr1g0357461 [Rosa chinensis]
MHRSWNLTMRGWNIFLSMHVIKGSCKRREQMDVGHCLLEKKELQDFFLFSS